VNNVDTAYMTELKRQNEGGTSP